MYVFESYTLLLTPESLSLRAQAAAMGGNAVLHYNVQQCNVNNMAGKQRVYSVLIVSGDAVCVTRNRSISRVRWCVCICIYIVYVLYVYDVYVCIYNICKCLIYQTKS